MPYSSPPFHGSFSTTPRLAMSLKPTRNLRNICYSLCPWRPFSGLPFGVQKSYKSLVYRPFLWRFSVAASGRSYELIRRSNEKLPNWFHQSKEFGRFAYDDYSDDDSDRESSSAQQLVSPWLLVLLLWVFTFMNELILCHLFVTLPFSSFGCVLIEL